mmetsp:Transcript_11683/g.16902  ORF Transcript_11683/g.16902 Transcript_11683/m.16902 type:complete len:265 (+) Transcript_11683:99-893(+)
MGYESEKDTKSKCASTPGLAMLERLRREPFNIATEEKLCSHPYIAAAESGSLTLAQRRAFAIEQFYIQRSDATSFAKLAGHVDWVAPTSLAVAKVPEAVVRPGASSSSSIPDLFQFLLGGEIYAAPLLLKHAQSIGLDEATLKSSENSIRAISQAYPSYWARLALGEQRAAGAAACAVNFPAWGRMCANMSAALASENHGYGYKGSGDEGLAFINFFATPIENLDEMAANIIEAEGVSYEDLVGPVRLLQEYELLFWDAVFAAE